MLDTAKSLAHPVSFPLLLSSIQIPVTPIFLTSACVPTFHFLCLLYLHSNPASPPTEEELRLTLESFKSTRLIDSPLH